MLWHESDIIPASMCRKFDCARSPLLERDGFRFPFLLHICYFYFRGFIWDNFKKSSSPSKRSQTNSLMLGFEDASRSSQRTNHCLCAFCLAYHEHARALTFGARERCPHFHGWIFQMIALKGCRGYSTLHSRSLRGWKSTSTAHCVARFKNQIGSQSSRLFSVSLFAVLAFLHYLLRRSTIDTMSVAKYRNRHSRK